MVDASAEIGDQAQVRPGLRDQRAVDPVPQVGHDHIRSPHRLGQFGPVHRAILRAQGDVEQLLHPCLDPFRQASRYNNT